MDHSTGVRCLATVLRVIITLVLMNWQLRGARASSRPAARWSTCAWPCRNHGSSSPAPVRTGCVHQCWSVIQRRLTQVNKVNIKKDTMSQCHVNNIIFIVTISLCKYIHNICKMCIYYCYNCIVINIIIIIYITTLISEPRHKMTILYRVCIVVYGCLY